ncbi:MAG: hypothetical protein HQM15_00340 [Deltaproteobacteria bacterium]|nr:hypothetical protein [Deltaproteobacteria bacterium]
MFIIVGSGPSGVACALGLLEMNKNVLMIDVGISLENEKKTLVKKMSSLNKNAWQPEWLDSFKEKQKTSIKGINKKNVYGSDFPYRLNSSLNNTIFKNATGYISNAEGGLSNVWGGAILPYTSRDTQSWPFHISRLNPHYNSLLSYIDYSHEGDNFLDMFDFKFQKSESSLKLSQQAQCCVDCLNKYKKQLLDTGIIFSKATLATKVSSDSKNGCIYCGLCLHGCPYGYIYNSFSTIEILKKNKNFKFLKGLCVQSIIENNNQVVISALTEEGKIKELSAERVYLACGPLATAKVILTSQGRVNEPIIMKDSQYFLLPITFSKIIRNVHNEELYTLAQLFIELYDSKISPHNIHLQLYSYNDLISDFFEKKVPFSRWLKSIKEILISRIGIIQGYLHSDDSSHIEVSLKKHHKLTNLYINGFISPNPKKVIKKLIYKVKQNKVMLGFNPIQTLLSIGLPGQGWHTGSTFPMKEITLNLNESDIYGRPHEYKRTHIVDSSVLPSIPATTITFSVMANAHRIAIESSNL